MTAGLTGNLAGAAGRGNQAAVGDRTQAAAGVSGAAVPGENWSVLIDQETVSVRSSQRMETV